MSKSFPKPIKQPKGKRKKYVAPRARVKRELYALLSKIVRWRDGERCVQAGSGRGRCYGYMTDGHVIVRAEYGVTFDLLNNHCQCQGHNEWHRHHEIDYQDWFEKRFGYDAWKYLKDKAMSCEGEKSMTTPELEELLAEYQKLWDNRPSVFTSALLVKSGYYGKWAQEHLVVVQAKATIQITPSGELKIEEG